MCSITETRNLIAPTSSDIPVEEELTVFEKVVESKFFLVGLATGLVSSFLGTSCMGQWDSKWGTDADQDGYINGEDCFDGPEPEPITGIAAADAHPGADETCDGFDQNCDGIDEIMHPFLFEDVDDDGFGSGDPVECVFSDEVSLYSNLNGDCNDNLAAMSPLAPELCNGIDDNCNGFIDDNTVDPRRWYADRDGDGYGDDFNFEMACEAPQFYVSQGSDCDDSDPNINPGRGNC